MTNLLCPPRALGRPLCAVWKQQQNDPGLYRRSNTPMGRWPGELPLLLLLSLRCFGIPRLAWSEVCCLFCLTLRWLAGWLAGWLAAMLGGWAAGWLVSHRWSAGCWSLVCRSLVKQVTRTGNADLGGGSKFTDRKCRFNRRKRGTRKGNADSGGGSKARGEEMNI